MSFKNFNLNIKLVSDRDVLTGATKLMLMQEHILSLRWFNKSLQLGSLKSLVAQMGSALLILVKVYCLLLQPTLISVPWYMLSFSPLPQCGMALAYPKKYFKNLKSF